jgi:hypothetical protein
MGEIIGLLCERLTGHRMGPWVPLVVPESQYARFERSRCRWCRQGYVRVQRPAGIVWD